jgi:hypothetical protein
MEELNQRRDERGTLLCTCGLPGKIFPYWKAVVVDGRTVGLCRGFCCEEHMAAWIKAGQPAEEEIQNVAKTGYKNVSLFD